MNLHTKIQEREEKFREYFDSFESDFLSAKRLITFNRTSSKELLLEIVKEIEGRIIQRNMMSYGNLENNQGYNQALTDIQNLITSQIKLIEV